MSSVAGVSVEEYLSTAYRPDCDYIEGEVRERNVGEYDHGRLQAGLAIWFGNHERDWRIRVVVEQRVRVGAGRFSIPDVCVIDWSRPIEQVFTAPPLICIEVLSKDDSLRSIRERVDAYLVSGTGGRYLAGGGVPDSRAARRSLRRIGSVSDDMIAHLRETSFLPTAS
jgi:Uma2 family endonuclease